MFCTKNGKYIPLWFSQAYFVLCVKDVLHLLVAINTQLKPKFFGKLLYNLKLTWRIKYDVDFVHQSAQQQKDW
jgi:hypothetical protein